MIIRVLSLFTTAMVFQVTLQLFAAHMENVSETILVAATTIIKVETANRPPALVSNQTQMMFALEGGCVLTSMNAHARLALPGTIAKYGIKEKVSGL